MLLKKEWQTPPELLWKRRIGAGWSGFAAVNGFAVTLEQRGPLEILACYEIATGEPRWTQQEETRHESTLGYVGPRSTPTIHHGYVYTLGATGRLRCVNGADGAVIWSHDLFTENGFDQEQAEQAAPWGRSASPLVVDQQVVVPLGGPPDGPHTSLIAFDAETGAEIWRSGKHQVSYASPSLVTLGNVRQILCVNEDHLTGHNVDTGEELWEYPWPSRSNAQAAASQALALPGDRVFISKGYSQGAELLRVERSSPAEWSTDTIWATRDMKTKFSNVAVHAGYAYGLDDGILACIALEDGKRQWKRGRYGFGQILLVEDVLLVLAEDGRVIMVDASPQKLRELGEFQAIEGQTWNTLCLYGDLLLVRNAEEAACFRLPLREPQTWAKANTVQ
jgi:outer membrane protein assembly factor BamB